jgi:tetratricopeptide (TPR) repeat protein
MKRFKRIGLILALVLGTGSFLCAQDPSILLEKAIYTEETLGNLNDAIVLYQQIAAATDASRATSALAIFRLGMCYQKSGSTEQAQGAFAKLLKLYPEQQDLIAKIPPPSSGQLELKPVPWADGEILMFAIKLKSGLKVGDLTYKFESTAESGRMAWKVKSIQGGGASASASADLANLPPISSLVIETTGRQYQAKYGAQQIENVITMDGASTKKTFQLVRTTYDDQQLIQILRCLPLQEGFQITFPIFSSNYPDAMVDAKIAVVAKERITVPAGSFDCYKTIVIRGNQSPSSTYWISADNHSYIVKVSENRLLGGTVPVPVDEELRAFGTAEKK